MKTRISSLGCTLAILALAGPVMAAPVVGFVEHFASAGSLGDFSGGATYGNPGTGGVLGDGYLRISRSISGPLAARAISPNYSGDWIAAGITRIELSLRDVDAIQNLQIHVAVGNSENFWLYNPAFVPPADHWGVFVVDLTDSLNFTHLINFTGGSFSKALREADRLQVRHDRIPFTQQGDGIIGEFGVDEIKLSSNPPVEALASSWGRLRALYR